MSIDAGMGTAVADSATPMTGLLDHLDYNNVALLTVAGIRGQPQRRRRV